MWTVNISVLFVLVFLLGLSCVSVQAQALKTYEPFFLRGEYPDNNIMVNKSWALMKVSYEEDINDSSAKYYIMTLSANKQSALVFYYQPETYCQFELRQLDNNQLHIQPIKYFTVDNQRQTSLKANRVIQLLRQGKIVSIPQEDNPLLFSLAGSAQLLKDAAQQFAQKTSLLCNR